MIPENPVEIDSGLYAIKKSDDRLEIRKTFEGHVYTALISGSGVGILNADQIKTKFGDKFNKMVETAKEVNLIGKERLILKETQEKKELSLTGRGNVEEFEEFELQDERGGNPMTLKLPTTLEKAETIAGIWGKTISHEESSRAESSLASRDRSNAILNEEAEGLDLDISGVFKQVPPDKSLPASQVQAENEGSEQEPLLGSIEDRREEEEESQKSEKSEGFIQAAIRKIASWSENFSWKKEVAPRESVVEDSGQVPEEGNFESRFSHSFAEIERPQGGHREAIRGSDELEAGRDSSVDNVAERVDDVAQRIFRDFGGISYRRVKQGEAKDVWIRADGQKGNVIYTARLDKKGRTQVEKVREIQKEIIDSNTIRKKLGHPPEHIALVEGARFDEVDFAAQTEQAVGDLEDFLRRPNMPPLEAAKLTLGYAKGMEELHEANLVAGDVKPDNCLVYQYGEEGHVTYKAKLADLGKAGAADRWFTKYEGNTRYAMDGHLNQANDIFGLGMVTLRGLEERIFEKTGRRIISDPKPANLALVGGRRTPIPIEDHDEYPANEKRRGIEFFRVENAVFPAVETREGPEGKTKGPGNSGPVQFERRMKMLINSNAEKQEMEMCRYVDAFADEFRREFQDDPMTPYLDNYCELLKNTFSSDPEKRPKANDFRICYEGIINAAAAVSRGEAPPFLPSFKQILELLSSPQQPDVEQLRNFLRHADPYTVEAGIAILEKEVENLITRINARGSMFSQGKEVEEPLDDLIANWTLKKNQVGAINAIWPKILRERKASLVVPMVVPESEAAGLSPIAEADSEDAGSVRTVRTLSNAEDSQSDDLPKFGKQGSETLRGLGFGSSRSLSERVEKIENPFLELRENIMALQNKRAFIKGLLELLDQEDETQFKDQFYEKSDSMPQYLNIRRNLRLKVQAEMIKGEITVPILEAQIRELKDVLNTRDLTRSIEKRLTQAIDLFEKMEAIEIAKEFEGPLQALPGKIVTGERIIYDAETKGHMSVEDIAFLEEFSVDLIGLGLSNIEKKINDNITKYKEA